MHWWWKCTLCTYSCVFIWSSWLPLFSVSLLQNCCSSVAFHFELCVCVCVKCTHISQFRQYFFGFFCCCCCCFCCFCFCSSCPFMPVPYFVILTRLRFSYAQTICDCCCGFFSSVDKWISVKDDLSCDCSSSWPMCKECCVCCVSHKTPFITQYAHTHTYTHTPNNSRCNWKSKRVLANRCE